MAKISGWILLVIGVLIIGWTLLYSYNIFTSRDNLPEFFKVSEEQSSTAAQSESSGTFDIGSQLNKAVGDQLKNILPMGSIFDFMNLTVWSVLAFILIFGGFQIANLGIKLLK